MKLECEMMAKSTDDTYDTCGNTKEDLNAGNSHFHITTECKSQI